MATTNQTIARREDRKRWIALVVICMGQLMIVLDATVVNVALPSIQSDLGFSQSNLTWVVDGYMITFGSFLMLAGRLGDLIGRKRIYLIGLASFVVASMLCGFSQSQETLVIARFLQGMAAALTSAVVLAIIAVEFPEPEERAKGMSVYSFVIAGGGSIGLLLGGVLTELINWHWIFFVNLPIGAVAFVASRALIPENEGLGLGRGVDWLGSVLITGAALIGIYALIKVPEWGWAGTGTVALAGVAVLLLAAFIVHEARIPNPIMPLRILTMRTLMTANLVRGVLVTGSFATFFLGALYFEHVRGLSPIQIGLLFMIMNVPLAIMSSGLTARLIGRFGAKNTLVFGIALVVAGMLTFSEAGPSTPYFPLIIGTFLLMGIGFGATLAPLMVIAMDGVPHQDAGLASGTIQVSLQLSAAAGIAALGTVATNHTHSLVASGHSTTDALSEGYHLAFQIGAGAAALGLLIALFLLPRPDAEAERDVEEVPPIAAEHA